MLYDIYKGSVEDMRDSGGELLLKRCSKGKVKEFCVFHDLDFNSLIDGDYYHGLWLEEAM